GLAAIVRAQWKVDLYGGHLFVFLGRRADRCKILFWDRGGFVLYFKRLERIRCMKRGMALQPRDLHPARRGDQGHLAKTSEGVARERAAVGGLLRRSGVLGGAASALGVAAGNDPEAWRRRGEERGRACAARPRRSAPSSPWSASGGTRRPFGSR